MGWVLHDDLSWEVIRDLTTQRRLSICLDGRELAGYDVGPRDEDDTYLRELGAVLVEGIAAQLAAERVGSGPGDDQPLAEWERDLLTDATDPAPEPGPSRHLTPVASSDGVIGLAASDADVRAWCATYGVQCSTRGRLNRSARRVYELAEGGAPTDDHMIAAGAVRLWSQPDEPTEPPADVPPASPGVDAPAPDPAGEGRAPGAAHDTPPTASEGAAGEGPPAPSERAGRTPREGAGAVNGNARPAVEPIGDGVGRPRPEQVDEAMRLYEQGYGPIHVADRTAMSLEQARVLKRDFDGPKGGRG